MIEFVKMHGIGNDYVYVDATRFPIDDPSALARTISDRHTGVGSDGLILLLPPENPMTADLRMRMFNADGSESEMCGNGIRCVCKLAYDDGLCTTSPMRIETGAGVLSLVYEVCDGRVERVTVDMGTPILNPRDIPTSSTRQDPIIDDALAGMIDWSESPDGRTRPLTCVSMGNPHVIAFDTDIDCTPLEQVGPWLEHHPTLPERANVHVVEVLGRDELRMRTWERGSGITRACGTGACAVVVAGVLTNRTDREVLVHLPGGDLEIHWDAATDHVSMTGGATEVFRGTWPIVVRAR